MTHSMHMPPFKRSKSQSTKSLKPILGPFGMLLRFSLSFIALGTAQAEVGFNRDVRPILSENCFQCHGFDKNTREADMRLDLREAAIEAEVLVPGKPEESEILARMKATDPDDIMPPPNSHKTLTAKEIATIEQWISEGAKYEPHWAYIPPVKAEVPADTHPIDYFIQARLKKEELEPAPEAPRHTLARRIHFDITGLPPSPEFVKNFDPKQLKQSVEELLQSEHYGERMAIHWLDLVRYADTVGYHGDQNMSVFPYRDYVIDAFNQNMRFDQFTREQLAGDLLENPTDQQLIATGYNRINKMTAEGGVQDKEYRIRYAGDRVRTTSTAWMGSTVGCSECHDHKFDPFSQKDFYQMAAFFADIEERGLYSGAHNTGIWGPSLRVHSEENKKKLAEFSAEIGALATEYKKDPTEAQTSEMVTQIKAELAAPESATWLATEPTKTVAKHGTELKRLETGFYLASGPKPKKENFTQSFELPHGNYTGVRLEVFPHKSLAKGRFGRGNGNIVMSAFEIKQGDKLVQIKEGQATIEQKGWPLKNALNETTDKGWAIDGHNQGDPQAAVFILTKALQVTNKTPVHVEIRHQALDHHNIGHFRISFTQTSNPGLDKKVLPAELVTAVNLPADKRNAEQEKRVADYTRAHHSHFRDIADKKQQVEAARKAFDESVPVTLITKRAKTPRPVRVLNRGDWMDETGEIVPPGVPHFMNQPTKKDLTRLDLADWLMDKTNPLTARVFVNRLWKMYFGTGISRVLDDLGSQGEAPEHQDLLDWLAVDFMESGWDVKRLVVTMLTSKTYQQSSRRNADLDFKDPYNRFHARQSAIRLDAELIRDNVLAVSGLLVDEIGGESAKPYQPEGYYRELNFPRRKYEADMNKNQWRRGIYTHWQRSYLHPAMMAFDAPSREECSADRPISNTPQQSLVLLNDPSFTEAARVFAARALQEGGDTLEKQINWAIQQSLSRDAKAKEIELLTALHSEETKRFKTDPESAKALIAIGNSQAPEDANAEALAAWTSVARALFNMQESIVRY